MNALVSIGIPTFNQPDFLRNAIRSVLDQDWSELEVIVVDDCSTDHTSQVVREFVDPRVRYYRTLQNLRPPKSWNTAARLARGEYFGLLPHDDVYLPGFVRKMVAAAQSKPDAAFAQCAFSVVNRDLHTRKILQAAPEAMHLSGEHALFWQMERLLCNPAAVLFRTSKLKEQGFWREDYWDDWALIVNLAYRWGFVFIPDVLAGVREHAANLSRVLDGEGRDGPLDILNQQADVFGRALPVTPALLAYRTRQSRLLSYSCFLTAWRSVLRGRWARARELMTRSFSLYPLTPISPGLVAHVFRGVVRRSGRRP